MAWLIVIVKASEMVPLGLFHVQRVPYSQSRDVGVVVVNNHNVFSWACVYHRLRCMIVYLRDGTPVGGDDIDGAA